MEFAYQLYVYICISLMDCMTLKELLNKILNRKPTDTRTKAEKIKDIQDSYIK